MGGEAVGVGPRGPLRVGQQVYFPVGLLEGLAYRQLGEPVPPGQDFVRVLVHGVPQLYAGGVVQPVQNAAVTADELAFVEDTGRRALFVCELPDQTPRQGADEGMIEVVFAPRGVDPAL